MNINNIPVPEIYQTSSDFRVFLKWISLCFSRIQYDIENMSDLYDPLRCQSNLLWMLADTMGYKYDDRFPAAYIRLVLLYFMSLIRTRGSRDGVTLAAELNLAQFRINQVAGEGYYTKSDIPGESDVFVGPKNILYDRLEDTSIPVNAAYVTQNTEAAYIDVVYFSDELPTDACIEYVRPLGMYCFQYAGVRYDAKDKISIDAKLADYVNSGQTEHSVVATHVGHYRRSDYASMQKKIEDDNTIIEEPRHNVYYRNSKFEETTTPEINPGYRALSSLQLCNNDGVVSSLIHSPIFAMGLEPLTDEQVDTFISDDDLKHPYNLRYNNSDEVGESVLTLDPTKTQAYNRPNPMISPTMATIGDAIPLVDSQGNPTGQYTHVD